MAADDRKWLYEKLKAAKCDIGSEAEFNSSIQNNEEDRRWYYDKAKELDLDMGSYDDFCGYMVEKRGVFDGALDRARGLSAGMPKEQKPVDASSPGSGSVFGDALNKVRGLNRAQESAAGSSVSAPVAEVQKKEEPSQPLQGLQSSVGTSWLSDMVDAATRGTEEQEQGGAVGGSELWKSALNLGKQNTAMTGQEIYDRNDSTPFFEKARLGGNTVYRNDNTPQQDAAFNEGTIEADRRYGAEMKRLENEIAALEKEQGRQFLNGVGLFGRVGDVADDAAKETEYMKTINAKKEELSELRRKHDSVVKMTMDLSSPYKMMANTAVSNAMQEGSNSNAFTTRRDADAAVKAYEDAKRAYDENPWKAASQGISVEKLRKEAVEKFRAADRANAQLESARKFVENFGVPDDINKVPTHLRDTMLELFPILGENAEKRKKVMAAVKGAMAMTPEDVARLAVNIGDQVDAAGPALSANTDRETLEGTKAHLQNMLSLFSPEVSRIANEVAGQNTSMAGFSTEVGASNQGVMSQRVMNEVPEYKSYKMALEAIDKALW